jgi:hypothetical protein
MQVCWRAVGICAYCIHEPEPQLFHYRIERLIRPIRAVFNDLANCKNYVPAVIDGWMRTGGIIGPKTNYSDIFAVQLLLQVLLGLGCVWISVSVVEGQRLTAGECFRYVWFYMWVCMYVTFKWNRLDTHTMGCIWFFGVIEFCQKIIWYVMMEWT